VGVIVRSETLWRRVKPFSAIIRQSRANVSGPPSWKRAGRVFVAGFELGPLTLYFSSFLDVAEAPVYHVMIGMVSREVEAAPVPILMKSYSLSSSNDRCLPSSQLMTSWVSMEVPQVNLLRRLLFVVFEPCLQEAATACQRRKTFQATHKNSIRSS
jgi:hypothetical protein